MHNQMCYFEIIFKGTALYFELKTVKIEYMILHDIRILIDNEKNTRCDILTWLKNWLLKWIFKVVLSWLETTNGCSFCLCNRQYPRVELFSLCHRFLSSTCFIKTLDVCCFSRCPNYWIASEKMCTDRSSEHSCHFFVGKSAYVTEVIWNAVGPSPIQPCSWPPLVSCKAQAGELKKKKKKKGQTHYTHSGYLFIFYLDVSFSIGVRGGSRKGCSLSG